MNILHVYKSYHPTHGGIERHVRVLAESAAARGHAVTVLVAGGTRRTRVDRPAGVTVVRAGTWLEIASTPLSPMFFSALRRLARHADVVHLHAPYPLGEVAHLLAGGRVPTILTYHSDIVRQHRLARLYAPLQRRVLARADRIVVTSTRYRDTSRVLAPVRDACVAIPLGVAVEHFARVDPVRTQALRDRLGGDPTVPLLLVVGRLRYYKGLDTLLHALVAVPAARLLIVGTGPMERAWRALTTCLGLDGRVTFLGEIEDDALASCYHAADLFVLPANARAEAFGTVLLEAMAAGLACITTEVGSGTSWVVEHGVTGLVVPPRDPPALAAAITTLLADADRRRQLGAAGAERVHRRFTERAMVEAVDALYARVVR